MRDPILSASASKLAFIFSAAFGVAVSFSFVQAQTPIPKPAAYQHYAQHDIAPRDGWDDDWQKKYPAHTADKTADPDGDGISNWEEMLDVTDPGRANKRGEIYISPEELARQAEAAVQAREKLVREWPQKQAELVQTTRPAFDGKAADPEFVRNDDAKQKQAAAKRLADGIATQPALERALNGKRGLSRMALG